MTASRRTISDRPAACPDTALMFLQMLNAAE
jgi:hypothetical protein